LSLAFEQRRVHKAYVAVVEGWIEAERGVIDAPLIADWPRRPRQMVDPIHGKPALTRWRVLERRGDSATGLQTRVHLEPTTGRSHQLRVHLAHIGHPIVGDPFYGNSSVAPTGRLLLHASMLAFHHPATGEPMQFDSAAPF
jgi:tRNA pseudouridine32 synthase / 23S rRNA pseudouridine746 synthase